MKVFSHILRASLCALFFAQNASAAEYELDQTHTFVYFQVMHLNMAPAFGQFTKTTGTLNFDPARSLVRPSVWLLHAQFIPRSLCGGVGPIM